MNTNRFILKKVEGFDIAYADMRKSYKSYEKASKENDDNLASALAHCKHGSGHDSFLKDIVVWYDVIADHSTIPQLYRYHFRDTSSSESKQHTINKAELTREVLNPLVSDLHISLTNELIRIYNNFDQFDEDRLKKALYALEIPYFGLDKKLMFECIIMNLPIGYELQVGEVTNYLQLKTMYYQRKSHKMSVWNTDFVKFVESLPNSYLITGVDKEK